MGSPKVDVKLFVRQPFQCFSLSPTPTCFASLHAYAWNVYTMNFPSVVFFITYGNEHFIKKMIFIIHYSVHFLATPPSKISTGTKKQNAAYNDETYAVWRMETVFDLPSKKICSASRKWMASIVSRKTSGNSPQKRCNFKGHLSILIYLHSCEIPITMA
jgi:hypothetical protein